MSSSDRESVGSARAGTGALCVQGDYLREDGDHKRGHYLWYETYRGVSNISSVISIRPWMCAWREDISLGLLGVFGGLFTAEEV